MTVESTAAGSTAAPRRIDVFRRDGTYVAVAREDGHGSIGLLFAGDVAGDDREALGAQALEWLDAARQLPLPASPLDYPEDLLPDSWDLGNWRELMAEAALVVVDTMGPDHLRLRPYKNLSPVGEDFSHEGSHSLDCAPRAAALGSGLRAALDVSSAISQVHRAPSRQVGPPALVPEITAALRRLGARLFERPPHVEIVEVAEGFFVLPAPLRQLVFDVVWRPDARLTTPDGSSWRVTWFPLTRQDALRAWPLVTLAVSSDDERLLVRLDGERPHDPIVLRLPADADPAAVLGPATGPPSTDGRPLSTWLAGVEASS